jgi:hypothetical protein
LDFIRALKDSIKPKKPLNLPSLPTDRLTIGVHVRTGGGYDTQANIDHFSLKIPRLEYYEEQLKAVCEKFKNYPIYIHIATDDSNPKALAERLKKFVDHPDFVIGFRESGNRHNSNVLEDFFLLTKFDVLIRSASLFSFAASILSDYLMEVYPIKAERKIPEERAFITEVVIDENPSHPKGYILDMSSAL